MKMNYTPPTLRIYKVVMEESVAQTAVVSVEPRLYDWEDGGTIGDELQEGGDIYLIID